MALPRQKALFCPDCCRPPAIAGLCAPCYARRRHSALYFAGTRDRVLRRDGYRCQGCLRQASSVAPEIGGASRGAGNSPSVHHRRPGVHEERWLITICPSCHAVIHKLLSHRRWLPVPLLELWREQHPTVPVQLQLAIDASHTVASKRQAAEVSVPR